MSSRSGQFMGYGFIGIVAAIIFFWLSTTAYWPAEQQRNLMIAIIAGIGGVILFVVGFLSRNR
ncbi:MAG: hypothetical protein ACXADL_05465 [Candidatus Thorarchaeota archaeon]